MEGIELAELLCAFDCWLMFLYACISFLMISLYGYEWASEGGWCSCSFMRKKKKKKKMLAWSFSETNYTKKIVPFYLNFHLSYHLNFLWLLSDPYAYSLYTRMLTGVYFSMSDPFEAAS